MVSRKTPSPRQSTHAARAEWRPTGPSRRSTDGTGIQPSDPESTQRGGWWRGVLGQASANGQGYEQRTLALALRTRCLAAGVGALGQQPLPVCREVDHR